MRNCALKAHLKGGLASEARLGSYGSGKDFPQFLTPSGPSGPPPFQQGRHTNWAKFLLNWVRKTRKIRCT